MDLLDCASNLGLPGYEQKLRPQVSEKNLL